MFRFDTPLAIRYHNFFFQRRWDDRKGEMMDKDKRRKEVGKVGVGGVKDVRGRGSCHAERILFSV